MNENDKKEKVEKTDKVDFLIWIILLALGGLGAGISQEFVGMVVFFAAMFIVLAMQIGFNAVIKAIDRKTI